MCACANWQRVPSPPFVQVLERQRQCTACKACPHLVRLLSIGLVLTSHFGSYSSICRPWPSSIRVLLDVCRVALLDVLGVARVGCSSTATEDGLLYGNGFYVHWLLTAGLTAGVAMCAWLWYQRTYAATLEPAGDGGRGMATPDSQLVSVSARRMRWSMCLVLCAPVVSAAARSWRCAWGPTDAGGVWYLVSDPVQQCFTAGYWLVAAVSLFAAAAFVLGIPAAVAWTVTKHRKELATVQVYRQCGELYEDYQPAAAAWGAIDLLRIGALVSLGAIIDPGSPLQVNVWWDVVRERS